ncbi:hypothetical protein [Leisingera sp. ANG-M6]|uniref:hypothetical protein n=1 Tax=Leisingera sp. ANG-M6 TaxID=1577900 RepID=UPI00057F8DA9|nr:hypothetical protein [Leisingera sp. ANG-M6]KIC30948.1 hypothetical protein RA24_00865 [Leisingera sp. ANG-M6]
MPETSKIFTYAVDGLAYTVTVYEENGEFFADITVDEGAMDVNAIYFGDDDFSGSSVSLSGPLNMNGTRLDGEKVQWDEATELSNPGLGPEGEDKETYLQTGDTMTVSLDIESLDEIDIFGIRATSTTNDAGSIKGVSGDPEEPEEPEDPEEPTYEKVFFGEVFSDSGDPLGGTFILDEEPDPNPYSIPALPEGTEPTFDNYLSYFLSEDIGGDLPAVQSVVFYGTGEDGAQEELFRIDAPEGGFQSADDLLAAYDDALEATGDLAGQDLMAALSLEDHAEADPEAEEDLGADEFELL